MNHRLSHSNRRFGNYNVDYHYRNEGDRRRNHHNQSDYCGLSYNRNDVNRGGHNQGNNNHFPSDYYGPTYYRNDFNRGGHNQGNNNHYPSDYYGPTYFLNNINRGCHNQGKNHEYNPWNQGFRGFYRSKEYGYRNNNPSFDNIKESNDKGTVEVIIDDTRSIDKARNEPENMETNFRDNNDMGTLKDIMITPKMNCNDHIKVDKEKLPLIPEGTQTFTVGDLQNTDRQFYLNAIEVLEQQVALIRLFKEEIKRDESNVSR